MRIPYYRGILEKPTNFGHDYTLAGKTHFGRNLYWLIDWKNLLHCVILITVRCDVPPRQVRFLVRLTSRIVVLFYNSHKKTMHILTMSFSKSLSDTKNIVFNFLIGTHGFLKVGLLLGTHALFSTMNDLQLRQNLNSSSLKSIYATFFHNLSG